MVDLAAGRQRGRERLVIVAGRGFEDLDDRAVFLGMVEEFDGPVDVVSAEHNVDVPGPLHDRVAILLGETAADRDLEVGVLGLQGLEVAEGAIELVVGVLTDAAGVEHDDVGVGVVLDAVHAVGLEQARDALGVVLVHLAAVRLDDVGLAVTACGGVAPLLVHTVEATDTDAQAVSVSIT